MHRNAFELPRGLSASETYAMLMRRGAYYFAAHVARRHELGRPLEVEAAYKAFCRFEDFGFDAEALIVAAEFGLIVTNVTAENFIAALRRDSQVTILQYSLGVSGAGSRSTSN
jgi:hypothetical protein